MPPNKQARAQQTEQAPAKQAKSNNARVFMKTKDEDTKLLS